MILTGDAFGEALHAAGILPDHRRVARVVIDARPGHALVMHVQYLADERILDVVPGLDGVQIRRGGEEAT